MLSCALGMAQKTWTLSRNEPTHKKTSKQEFFYRTIVNNNQLYNWIEVTPFEKRTSTKNRKKHQPLAIFSTLHSLSPDALRACGVGCPLRPLKILVALFVRTFEASQRISKRLSIPQLAEMWLGEVEYFFRLFRAQLASKAGSCLVSQGPSAAKPQA